jgi:3-oxoacyl-[acyl-carrier-protein] synthase II
MPGEVKASLERMYQGLMSGLRDDGCAIISGATGAEPATAEERQFIRKHPELAARATGTYLGHGVEPQFLMNVALGAMALRRGSLFHPLDQSGVELPMTEPLLRAIVTGVGHWRGEGMALLDRVSSPDTRSSSQRLPKHRLPRQIDRHRHCGRYRLVVRVMRGLVLRSTQEIHC